MRLIIIDGLDAAGKDTHAQLIKKRYEDKGESVTIRSHPEDDNRFGRIAKQALLGRGKRNKIKASIFYALDVIRSLRRYYRKDEPGTLILVRYLMGTAYLPMPFAKIAYNFFKTFLPTSDYMFFLDVSLDEALGRLGRREMYEMFETQEELVRVRNKALYLSRDGWHVINTCRPKEVVAAEINRILDELDEKYE